MPVSTSSFVLLLSYRILSSILIFGSLLSGIFPFIVSWIIQHWTLPIDTSIKGFPGGSDGKESACNVGDLSLIPGSGRSPGGGLGNPLQYSCLENLHGQRNLAGYCPWGSKEADITEWWSTAHNNIVRLDSTLNGITHNFSSVLVD